MRTTIKQLVLAAICIFGIQQSASAQMVNYSKEFNDPYAFRNLNLCLGLWGFDVDKTEAREFRSLQLNFFTKHFAIEGRYMPSQLFYMNPVKNKYDEIRGFTPTYIPYEGTLVLNLSDEENYRDIRINLYSWVHNSGDYQYTDTRYISVPSTERKVQGLRLGFQQKLSTGMVVRHLSSLDSVLTYHHYTANTFFVGYDYKLIKDYFFKVESYKKKAKARNINNLFIDLMYAPFITVDPVYNDSTYSMSGTKKQPFGGRFGYQFNSTRRLGLYTRVEVGARPGIVWKGNAYFLFSIGAELSARIASKGKYDDYDDYNDYDW